jgi:ketopantoate hydroxymethyltransferase
VAADHKEAAAAKKTPAKPKAVREDPLQIPSKILFKRLHESVALTMHHAGLLGCAWQGGGSEAAGKEDEEEEEVGADASRCDGAACVLVCVCLLACLEPLECV